MERRLIDLNLTKDFIPVLERKCKRKHILDGTYESMFNYLNIKIFGDFGFSYLSLKKKKLN